MVEVAIEPPGRTSLRSRYRMERSEDLIAEAALTHVCVDATTFDKRPWPQWFRDGLAEAATP